ncbi:DUF3883 domain-containing protein [Afifella sp. H1R]|nr:DUF3883 domain-containing protein [Afifella sp. H1R]
MCDGYQKIKDTSANSSFDFTAVRNGNEFVVEVKGTTTNGEAILITAAEVKVHKARYPQNILILVSSIELVSDAEATCGLVQVHAPWDAQAAALEPIAYRCIL